MFSFLINIIKQYNYIFFKNIVIIISLIFSKIFYVLSLIVSFVRSLFKKFYQVFHFILYNIFRLFYFIYDNSIRYVLVLFLKISIKIYSILLFYFNYLNLILLILKTLIIRLNAYFFDISIINKTFFNIKKYNLIIFKNISKMNIFFLPFLFIYKLTKILFSIFLLLYLNFKNIIINFLKFNLMLFKIFFNLNKSFFYFIKIFYYKYIVEFSLKIKLYFYYLFNNIKLILKNRVPFVYSLFIYSRPGYFFFVFYFYFLIIFPLIFILNQTILNSFFNLENDWSWYGTIYPLNENVLNYFFDETVINLYMNKKVWFFKFGDHADLFLLDIFLSIFYFVIMIPYIKQIWFDEDNWDNLVNDIDEDEEGWDDEHDFEDIDEGVDVFEGEQNGDEIFEYYDDLRDKSFIKGRFKNFTLSNGHIIPGEIGWGFFLSYWIFTFYYVIKLMFWPEIPMFGGFPGIDLGETAPGLFSFLETYPQYNLQIYSAWMPGSPLLSSWQGSNLLDTRIAASELYMYNWNHWNKRLKEGFLDISFTFNNRTATPYNLGLLDYDFSNTRDYMFQNFERYFELRKAYSSTDVWNEIYGIYPFAYNDLNFWKRSVTGVRSFLNPMYDNGFNYLYFWPRAKEFTSFNYSNLNIHEWYLNNKSEHVLDNSLNRKDYRYMGNNIDLDRVYFMKINKTNEPYEFPLTYSQKKRGVTFNNKFLQGFGDSFSNYYTSVVDHNSRQYESSFEGVSVIYDYGLTPFHLDLNNDWWFWLDKPLTSNLAYAKGFSKYLYELQKNMDNSYNRWVILKLWYTYWEGHYKVSQLFYADKVMRWNYSGDLFSLYEISEKPEGEVALDIEPQDKMLNEHVFFYKQRYTVDIKPYWSEISDYEYFDYLINDYLVGNDNSKILQNTYLYNPAFKLNEMINFKEKYHNTLYKPITNLLHFTFLESDFDPETSRPVNSFFKFGDFYALRETGETKHMYFWIDRFFYLKNDIYHENFELYSKASNFLYNNLMTNTEPLFGLRGLPYNSASVCLSTDLNDKKYETYDTNLQHLFFLRFTYVRSDLLENLFLNKFSKLWLLDFSNYNLYMNNFPYNLPNNLYLSDDNYILMKSDKLFLLKQTIESNESRKPFFFENSLKLLLSNFYIDYDNILEKLQAYRIDLGFFSKSYNFHYIYSDELINNLNNEYSVPTYVTRNSIIEKEEDVTGLNSQKQSELIYYITSEINDKKIIPYYFRDLNFNENASLISFFSKNRNLVDLSERVSSYIKITDFLWYDPKYFNFSENLSYDLIYNLYYYKSNNDFYNIGTIDETLFLSLEEIFYLKQALNNSNLNNYINNYWSGDMAVWYCLSYDIDIIKRINYFHVSIQSFINLEN